MLVAELADGQALGTAVDRTAAVVDGFDVGTALGRLLALAVLAVPGRHG
jgi:hypothetical protein